jgi:hypothetical protein
MPNPSLTILNTPRLADSTLLLALTGWMDGGHVSTGTVRHLMQGRDLSAVARIEPGGFYIDNFPGDMDTAAMFRPEVKHKGGLVKQFDFGTNEITADPKNQLAFFLGKEPNVNWPGFADCVFEVCAMLNVRRIIFIGSFGGTVPHTREPRMYGSVSHRALLPVLEQHAIRPSDYQGPGSFASYLVYRAPRQKVEMLSIGAEIPGYLQGTNPLSIEAVTRRLGRLLALPINLAELRAASTDWELKVSAEIEKDDDLTRTVRQLEEQYDNDLIGAAAETDDNGEEDQRDTDE